MAEKRRNPKRIKSSGSTAPKAARHSYGQKTNRIDWMLIAVSFVLVVFGLIMMYSASSYNAQIKFGDPASYLKNQLRATLVGIGAMAVATIIPYDFWKSKWSYAVYVISAIATMLVLSPIGIEANGAKRWIDLKFFSLQPSEIVKVAVILTMAYLIVRYRERLGNLKTFAFILIPVIAAAGLVGVVTDDLGTAVIIFAMGIIMIALVCPKKKYIVYTVLLLFVAAVGFILIRPNKRLRILAWLNPEAYADDASFQITQGLYAIGSGGLFGKGLGKSTQKMGFVPESQNDMIFSVICEELGIFGALMLLSLVAILLWRMWKLYRDTEDIFGKLIIAGVMAHIGVQTFVNMGVVSGLLPNTGVPLPFISYGGSSIMMTLLEIGLVLSVGRGKSMRKQPEKKQKPVIREDKSRGVIYYR